MMMIIIKKTPLSFGGEDVKMLFVLPVKTTTEF